MIDVIIPVHSSNGNLERTLSSIAYQKISDKVNVVLINDFSYDFSNLIDFFKDFISIKEVKLDRFLGVNYARKAGIENSDGSYIMFMNPGDTFICRDVVKRLYDKIKNGNYDYVCSDIVCLKSGIFGLNNLFQGLQGKIFKRKLFEKNNIFYNECFYSDTTCFFNMLSLFNPVYDNLNINSVLIEREISYFSSDDIFEYNFNDLINNISRFTSCFTNYISNKKDYYKNAEIAYSFIFYMYFWYLNSYNLDGSLDVIRSLKELIDLVNNFQLDEKLKSDILDRKYESYYSDFRDSYLNPYCSFGEFLFFIEENSNL